MKVSLESMVLGLNRLRWEYISFNNELIQKVMSRENIFLETFLHTSPEISLKTKKYLEFKSRIIMETVTNNICFKVSRIKKLITLNSPKTKRFPSYVVKILECYFTQSQYPSIFMKEELIKSTNLTMRQINNWFMNRRNRRKNLK
ncbi:homeodomain domain-containing protein [Encephalitozoon hellem]|nr:homeodomain domain-containing protein [Encephalitozoon hellem]